MQLIRVKCATVAPTAAARATVDPVPRLVPVFLLVALVLLKQQNISHSVRSFHHHHLNDSLRKSSSLPRCEMLPFGQPGVPFEGMVRSGRNPCDMAKL